MEDADSQTFTVIDAENCIAKDKNGYFRGNEYVTEELLNSDSETKAIIEKDKLAEKKDENK